ncbi:MAG: Ig-like domain repeat protein [Elusimicrobiales bacterium]|nr:Ig-like domain repeat protein [Elusimicrobiales bacterium]
MKALAQIAGTAYEMFGVRSASVSVQESDTLLYYSQLTSTFSSVSQVWMTAALGGSAPSYTWTLPAPAFQDDRNYNFQVVAEDMAGNVMTPPTPTVMRYDVTAPIGRVLTPGDNSYLRSLPSVTGTAQDLNSNPSGVAGTQIKIQRVSDANYWNGSIWTGTEAWLGAVSGSPWTKNTQMPPADNFSGLVDGQQYLVQARSYDVAGNTQSVLLGGSSFRFDISSPAAHIELPGHGLRYSSLDAIGGTAEDTFNVAYPRVRIYDIGLNKYWMDGSGSCGGTALPNWVGTECGSFPDVWNLSVSSSSTGGSFSWSYPASQVTWPDRDNELRVEVRAYDEAGNYGVASSTFSYDRTAPASRILYPPADEVLYSSMASISGTSLDLTSSIGDVQITMWYLSGGVTYYWVPSAPHWDTAPGWQSISGAQGPKLVYNPWSYTNSDFNNPGTINFAWKEGTHDGLNGKRFYVATRAKDGTGNFETSYSTRTFIFDNEPPVSRPVVPGPDTAYRELTLLSGTSVDQVTTVASVYVSILSQDEAGGAKYFDGSSFINESETWLPVTNLYASSWTYTNGLLTFADRHHYVVKSSATDSIGNVQSVTGQSRFLYDLTEPASSVLNPINGSVYNDNKVVLGNAADPGFTNGINGTGSGVFPSLGWHAGRAELLVFRDTEPYISASGPFLYGSWDESGYFWNGSTWTPVSAGPVWVPAQYTDALGNWQYSGLVCPSPNPTGQPCWARGDPYSSWVRATDNAGVVQTIISQGPKFYIAAPAQSFLVTVSQNPMTAGADVNMTVEAKDGPDGAGNRASAYQGTVNFYIDGVPGGPETMDTNFVLDDIYGLPPQTAFLSSDYGIKTFQFRLRKAAARAMRVEDNDNSAIYGTRNVTVTPTSAEKLQVIADYDPAGEQPAPGTPNGRSGAPRTKPAGSSVPVLLQVTDKYWNLVVSSAASVYVTDTDPNNAAASPDGVSVFTGSATLNRVFVSADPTGWTISASGQGSSDPSSPVPVIANAADRLLALLPGETRVQGKYSAEPYGKSGVPADQQAGSTFTVTVYGVDAFYNTDPTAVFQVGADIPTDLYDADPPLKNLVAGATVFAFTPVTASSHSIRTQSGALPSATSSYMTPNPVAVWWNRPVRLHMIPEGMSLAPGLPPYGSNPSPGGKSGTVAELTAGATTQVTVYLTDNYYNVVRGVTPFIAVSSNTPVAELRFDNDPNIVARGLAPSPYQKSLVAGATTFSFVPVTRNQGAGLSVTVTDTGLNFGSSFSTDTVSGLIVDPDAPVALQLLVPSDSGGGEQPAEGTVAGKTGTPGPLTAGAAYTIKVRSVDAYNNLSPDGRQVKLTSNDIYADHPARQPLAGGEAIINNFVPSAATDYLVINAVDDDTLEPKLSTQTDSGITVDAGAAARMLFVLPTQTLVPGKTSYPYGVSGAISTQTAGNSFTATLYAADSRYNRVYGVTRAGVPVSSDDPFVSSVGIYPMADGAASVTGITFRTAGARVMTAADPNAVLSNAQSGQVPVSPNIPTRLRVLPLGESRRPGSTTNGRADSPDPQQAGFPFTVTVDITDAFWNLVPGASQEIRLVPDDPYAQVAPPTQVIVTSATFTVTPIRSGQLYLRAETLNTPPDWGPSLAKDTSTAVNVAPGVPKRLLLTMPGESFAPGSASGKSGAPSQALRAGTSFGVRVGVVDDYFNLVTGRSVDVEVNTPTDQYADAVSTAAINTLTGYTDIMYVNMKKAATHYLTATDFSATGLGDEPQSSTFTLRPADPVGLQVVLPGETRMGGSGIYPAAGRSVTPSTQTAGTEFSAQVNLVDRYMNRFTDLSVGPTVYIVTSDSYDTEPSSQALNNGTLQIPLSMVTRNSSAWIKAWPVSAADNRVCSGNPPLGNCLNDDAAAKASFKVWASTGTRLEVVLPGQTLAEGRCNISPPCRDAGISRPGRSGTVLPYTIGGGSLFANVYLTDRFYNKVSELTGAAQDSNPVGVMPEVKILIAQDGKTVAPPPQELTAGAATFSIEPRTSLSTYTVTASTTSSSAASYSLGISTLTVFPGQVARLSYVLPSTNVVAGQPFSASLYALDAYDNICSTGPNIYVSTAAFVIETQPNPNQQPEMLSNDVYFSSASAGVRVLTDWFTFRKAGLSTLGAEDTFSPAINVSPLVDLNVSPGPPSVYKVDPNTDQEVGAGSISNPGRQPLTAQLTDSYDNNISSAGLPAYLEIAELAGSQGAFEYYDGLNWQDIGVSTIVYTDPSGRIGVSTSVAYRVSSAAGDWARVWIGTTTINLLADYIAKKQNVTGMLTTTGGTPSKLLYVSSQASAEAGILELPGAGAAFTVERRDDFGNITKQGQTDVYLVVLASHVAVHTGLGRSLGSFGTVGDYGFRNIINDQFIAAVSILPGQSQASYRYHDRVASYSGVSPASNTAEGGRPGYWHLIAQSGSMQSAVHLLRMNPQDITKVAFATPQRTMTAAKTTNALGESQYFRAELRDMFDNPRVTTAAVQVLLSTVTRQNSIVNNSFGFSASTTLAGGFPPVFASTISYVDIPLDRYAATFYYLDTTASSVYSVAVPTRPIVGLSVPAREEWAGSTQSVTITPDYTYRVNVRSGAGQVLTAGTTSQMFTLAVEDLYGNPTPVGPGQEDNPGQGIAFSLVSGSAGNVRFSWPGTSSFTAQPGTAKLKLGESTTSFFLIDTLLSAPTHQFSVNTVVSKGWVPAVASYTVVAAAPDHISFYTAPRRLVAGTTVQYADYSLGITTPTMITVVLKDAYDNTTTTGSAVSVRFSATRNSTYGGIDPSEATESSNPAWKLLNTNPISLTIFAGQSYSSLYAWDSIVGTAPVTAQAEIPSDGVVFPDVAQDQYITPSVADYFTLHHGYTLASPLRVLTPGTVTLRARDRYGNQAAGDPVNGQYYTGKIKMATNSRGSADLRDYLTSTTDYTFVPADQGQRQLRLEDTFVETLKVSVTDYNRPQIYGYTNDGERGKPAGSSGDVVLSGMIITPTDMAPQDPLPSAKTSIGINKVALYQGDGEIADVPGPTPMIRLTMQTTPAGSPPAYLKSLQVKSSGTLAYSDVTEVGFYADNPYAGQLGMLDVESELDGTPVDFFVSSGTYDPGLGTWRFDDLNVKVSTAVLISNSPKNFFLAVRISTVAATPRSLALVVEQPSYVVLDSTFVGVAYNNFPLQTSTAPVRNQPATINIAGQDIAAWWQPTIGGVQQPLGQYDKVDQGVARAGMLAIKAWTDNFLGTIRSFRIIKTGTGSGSSLLSMRLFLDSSGGNPALGDGEFQPSIDKEITDPVNPPLFNPDDPDQFTLPLLEPRIDGEISQSTRTYFVVYEMSPDAVPDQTHGARLETAGVSLLDGEVAAFSPINSSTVTVRATADKLLLADVNKSQPNDFTKPTSVTQNDKNKAIARLTVQVEGTEGAVVWTGLKLDRWITAGENGDTPVYNKVDDVSKISIWYDATGDGLLQSTGTVRDTEVLLVGGRNRTFPYDVLEQPALAADTTIYVKDVQSFFSTDSPFPRAPGRLIINDDQIDPSLKEVVYYTGVDNGTNAFTGVTRGAEGTAAVDWSSGTVISGQAVLPLIGDGGNLDGQSIYVAPKDYFVTFDMDPLATVDNMANIGLSMRGTDYFAVSPSTKGVSGVNIGVTPPGKSVSLVGRIREYADKVLIKSTDTVLGPTLQQKAQDQPIIAFTAETDVADAQWRWAMVYASGTPLSDGTAINDVERVKIWYDLDNNSYLGGGDVMIGSGTFGNTIYGPLVARVTFDSPVTLHTEGRALLQGISQRYFVTYDITSSAMPNDAIGNPRYLGAYLKSDSFPNTSPTVDDPVKNSFSLPNSLSGESRLPFESVVREIISAPSTVTVLAQPVFASPSGGSLDSVRLDQDITTIGQQDTVLVTSTAGLPTSGYLSVGNEIIYYNELHATVPAIRLVERGRFGSPAGMHSSGAALGVMTSQGDVNVPLLKLTMTTDGYGVRWESLRLARRQPAPLSGYDADASVIRVWKDNGNGIFDRDPVTGGNLTDVVVGQGILGDNEPVGRATISVVDPALRGQQYVVVGATPTVYFVSVSVDRASNFSHELVTPPNDVFGLEVQTESNFTFGPAGSGHEAYFPAPVQSPVNVVMPTINLVTLEPEDISPVELTQADRNVGLLSMKMKTDLTSARVESIRLERTGTSNDSDIDLIKIWQDSNDNCLFDSQDTAVDETGLPPNLMSYGNESYAEGEVNIVLKKPIVVTTTPLCAFVSYDVSQFAVIGSTMGLFIGGTEYFAIGIPNAVVFTTSPIRTAPITVREIPSYVVMGAYDSAYDLLSEGGVGQAQVGAAMLRFNLTTEAGNARWSAMKLQRTGASNDPSSPFGKNTDVKFINIYQDSNQNDTLDINDINVSRADTRMFLPVASTMTVPFQLVVESTAGFPASGSLFLSNAELMKYSGVGLSTATGRPYFTISERGRKLGELNTPKIDHAAGGSVVKVDLFDQDNPLNTQAQISLSQVQTLSPLAQTFFVVYDIGETAVKANKVGVRISDRSWFTVNAPHDVSPVIYMDISRTLPTGTYTAEYPYTSSLVPIRAVTLRISAADMAPRSTEKDTSNVHLLTLTLNTESDYVNIGRINLYQTGTISTTTAGLGDGDFSQVSVWKDDGDRVFSSVRDRRIATVLNSSAPFEGGVSLDILDGQLPYVSVSTSPVILYVSGSIGSVDRSGADILGHSAGVSLDYFFDLRGPNGLALAAGQSVYDVFPMVSGEVLVVPGVIRSIAEFGKIFISDNGYPAYAILDSSGNVVPGPNGRPQADPSRWIYGYTESGCAANEPLIDLNGDGVPDNFDFAGAGKCADVSLIGSMTPSYNLDNDPEGFLDYDFNGDGEADSIEMVDGKPVYSLGGIGPIPSEGAVPSAWQSALTSVYAKWPPASAPVSTYELAVSTNYDNPTSHSKRWATVGDNLSGKISVPSMITYAVGRLLDKVDDNTTSFRVNKKFDKSLTGKTYFIFVGNEIMEVTSDGAEPYTTFTIVQRAVMGARKISHSPNEPVSGGLGGLGAYVVSVRGVTSGGQYIPEADGASLVVMRPDTVAPPRPADPAPELESGANFKYLVKWARSDDRDDLESGIVSYELQERAGTNPVWHTLATIPYIEADFISYWVGDPLQSPGETPRPSGQYYTYRVRAWDNAGNYSPWSQTSAPAGTTVGEEVLSNVSNYPNPVDLRKGGVEGRTMITYTLNSDAEVSITIYDLLGYVVREWNIASGQPGAQQGPNFHPWDGKNGLGGIVSKGGYIVRIKASSPQGSKTILRKVGVIH